ncbi:hypothetical protein, partial [Yoonia sp.]|uniref:hypothetical protein n=1 Tax=Yoonia sp. TaxID=2212373 RepID=UPI00239F4D3C
WPQHPKAGAPQCQPVGKNISYEMLLPFGSTRTRQLDPSWAANKASKRMLVINLHSASAGAAKAQELSRKTNYRWRAYKPITGENSVISTENASLNIYKTEGYRKVSRD